MNWLSKIKRKFTKRSGPVMLSNGMIALPSGLISWGGSKYEPAHLLGLNTEQLQLRALQLWWESVHARGAINQLNTLTVNTGLRLQATIARKVLGISTEEAQEVSDTLEEFFKLYRQQKWCSHDGRHTFNELEIIGRRCWDVFGEVFGIMRYESFGPTLQLINPLSVKSPPTQVGREVTRGIEFKNGVAIGFWHEIIVGTSIEFEYIPFVGPNKKQMGVHCADIQTPDQIRGLTRLAPVFDAFKRILESLQYEMDSMATNATIAMVVERTATVLNKEKFEQEFANAGAGVPFSVDQIDADTVTTDRGGMVVQSGEVGEVFKPFDTSRPNVNIPTFIDKSMEWIGPAIGLPATVWKMLFSSNYSASRGELALGWLTFDVENYRFSTSFEQVFYVGVVSHMVATGRVILRGWSDPMMRAAWLVAKWRGVPMPSLNPLQEAKASAEKLRIFATNHEQESQKATGTSFEENIERQKHEMRHLKDIRKIYDDAGVPMDVRELGFTTTMRGSRDYADDMALMYQDAV